MYHQRPAPSPPSTCTVPPNDPFPTYSYFSPFGDRSPCSTLYTHTDRSTESLLPPFASYQPSVTSRTPEKPPRAYCMSAAYSTCASQDLPSPVASITRSSRSPISYLSGRSSSSSTSSSKLERLLGYPDLGQHSTRSISISSSTTSPRSVSISASPSPRSYRGESVPSPTYSIVPTGLGFLDQRNSRTLLRDLEMIVGKKLEFPMLKGLGLGRSTKEKKAKQKEERMERVEKEETRDGSTVRDDCRDEGDWFWEKGAVIVEKKKGLKGRGVREGNWI